LFFTVSFEKLLLSVKCIFGRIGGMKNEKNKIGGMKNEKNKIGRRV